MTFVFKANAHAANPTIGQSLIIIIRLIIDHETQLSFSFVKQ
jgi:hypothetical protein